MKNILKEKYFVGPSILLDVDNSMSMDKKI